MLKVEYKLLVSSSCCKNRKVTSQDICVRKNKNAKLKICASIIDCSVLLPTRDWAYCWMLSSSILMSYSAKLLLLVLSSALPGLWHCTYSSQEVCRDVVQEPECSYLRTTGLHIILHSILPTYTAFYFLLIQQQKFMKKIRNNFLCKILKYAV